MLWILLLAASPPASHLKGPGAIYGVEPLVLMQGPATDQRPAVAVQVEGVPALAILDLARGTTRIGRNLAREAGLDVRRRIRDGEVVEVTVIPKVQSGQSLLLQDVPAQVVDGDDLVLGLATLGRPVRIEVSTGRVLFPEDAEGSGDRIRVARWRVDGLSHTLVGPAWRLPGGVGDREGAFVIDTASSSSRVIEAGTVTVEGLVAGTAHYPRPFLDPREYTLGVLGWDVLGLFDWTVSESGLEMERAQTFVAADPAPVHLRALQYRVKDDEIPKPSTSVPEGDPGDQAMASRWRAYADALWISGSYAAALDATQQAAWAVPDDCATWQLLARRQWAMGKSGEAADEHAAALWAAWASLSAEERQGVRSGEASPGTFSVPQSMDCRPNNWAEVRQAVHEERYEDVMRLSVGSDHLGVQWARGIAAAHLGKEDIAWAAVANLPLGDEAPLTVAMDALETGWTLDGEEGIERVLELLRVHHDEDPVVMALEHRLLETERRAFRHHRFAHEAQVTTMTWVELGGPSGLLERRARGERPLRHPDTLAGALLEALDSLHPDDQLPRTGMTEGRDRLFPHAPGASDLQFLVERRDRRRREWFDDIKKDERIDPEMRERWMDWWLR